MGDFYECRDCGKSLREDTCYWYFPTTGNSMSKPRCQDCYERSVRNFRKSSKSSKPRVYNGRIIKKSPENDPEYAPDPDDFYREIDEELAE